VTRPNLIVLIAAVILLVGSLVLKNVLVSVIGQWPRVRAKFPHEPVTISTRLKRQSGRTGAMFFNQRFDVGIATHGLQLRLRGCLLPRVFLPWAKLQKIGIQEDDPTKIVLVFDEQLPVAVSMASKAFAEISHEVPRVPTRPYDVTFCWPSKYSMG
jgi:hypothetical protein